MAIVEVKTRILAGGRVEIPSTGLPEGSEATVRIVVEEAPPKRKLSEILADYPGGQLFKSVEEVDRYIKEERESWGD
jgi:hypothetical protein